MLRVATVGMFAICVMSFEGWAADVQPRTVTVSGEGDVKAAPDQVEVCLGVSTFSAKSALEAKSDNDAKAKKIIATFKELQIDPTDYQTREVSVQPVHERDAEREERPDKLLGYTANNELLIKLKDLGSLSTLIMKALEAGANSVNNVSFKTTRFRECQNEARRLAMRAARDKAELLAGEIGQKIGKARTITETSTRFLFGGSGGHEVADISEPTPVIVMGQIKIMASVTVTFDLE